VAALAALVGPQAVAGEISSRDEPMRFALVRSSVPGCEPKCPEWISAEGRITVNSAARFEAILAEAGGRKLPLFIDSPGGDLRAALAMGRSIRRNGLAVAVGRTVYEGCTPEETWCGLMSAYYRGNVASTGAFCFSACPLVLAGGTARFVGEYADAGVHRVSRADGREEMRYRKKRRAKVRAASGGVRSILAAYFREMGISRRLLTLLESTPATEIRVLDMKELRATRLATALTGGESLADPAACRAESPPTNCVVR
jgi:hypothetical protein